MAGLVSVVDWSKWQRRVGHERISRMHAHGVRGVVVGSWHGLDANPHAEADLRDARALGMITSTYIVVNNRRGADAVNAGRTACGREWEHLRSVWIDVEVAGVTETILQDALNAAERQLAPGRVGVYTGKWFWDFWQLSVGHAIRQFSDYPLWTALYNGRRDLEFIPYGGWTSIVGHQYAGSTAAFGTTVDFNVFDRDWFMGERPTPTPEPEPPAPEEEPIVGRILDLFTTAGRQLEAEIANAKKLPEPIPGPAGPPGPQGPAGQDAPAPSPGRTYTVRSGDTLSGIAAKYDGVTWQAIYAANRQLIGDDPDVIQPGMVLTIP
jgi:GH25 family lysozyme M1 (1,4-beta-N-acetylmuramidase)